MSDDLAAQWRALGVDDDLAQAFARRGVKPNTPRHRFVQRLIDALPPDVQIVSSQQVDLYAEGSRVVKLVITLPEWVAGVELGPCVEFHTEDGRRLLAWEYDYSSRN